LLQSDHLIFLVFDLLEDFLACLLILSLEGVWWKWALPIFNTLLAFALAFEFGSTSPKMLLFSCFFHDAEINLPLFLIHQSFVCLLDDLEGLLRPRILELIWVDKH